MKLTKDITPVTGRDAPLAIFLSIGTVQGAHVVTLHLEQDRAMEDSKKYQGCRNASQSSCRFRTLLKSLTVLIPQNDVRQVLSDSYSKAAAGKKS